MNNMILITPDELSQLISKAVRSELEKTQTEKPNPKIKGIHALSKALGCSISKAQNLKNSGNIRYFQDGKLVLFDLDQVIEDLKGQNLNKTGPKKKK